ncbi:MULTISPECIES: DoxX family protein [unclassified Brenneria]|uniref:DoxX family protein n=1 Tax=unclassified Brenneria TaxID=2634434 RepID=UPI0029C51B1E|nr:MULTISPECIES: DoxX family protein [unclassified Brenneria]MDX5627173.1 DoxX family protein [Brenneria sp. L3-3Z]MDX5694672.1 DoxX family protein [Brenneria sp. L4-2C]MEE3664253.1 DoxX family protein [Brenneria sp. g21c3]
MSKISAKQWLAYALVAFFVVGGIGNIIAPQPIADDYARWGYPHWFHYVTGCFELIAAFLIARKTSRLAGSVIAIGIMSSAVATVIYHGEYTHAIAPCVVLILLLLSVYLHRK